MHLNIYMYIHIKLILHFHIFKNAKTGHIDHTQFLYALMLSLYWILIDRPAVLNHITMSAFHKQLLIYTSVLSNKKDRRNPKGFSAALLSCFKQHTT